MDSRTKIVRTDLELECPHLDQAIRVLGANLVLLPDGVSEEELLNQTRDADLILMCYTPITAKVIASAKRLKGIVKYGVGIDAIDIDAAKAHNIPVVNIPEYAEETVAEGAFALMIALAKKLLPMQAAMQTEGWVWPTNRWIGSDISGKTVGLVGVGKIGKSMARMAGLGFGAKILGYDPYVSAEDMHSAGVEKRENLVELLQESDFVSVHCVLNNDTQHLIGEKELRAMKPTAMLINVSRGALIDESALVLALQDSMIAGAGLDVYSKEPLNREDHPMRALYEMDNVILSPHLTFYTREAMQRLEEETLERCLELLEGQPVTVKSKDPRLRAQESGVIFRD
ncbi:C-terminal binding protein [Pseudohalocynthiibacter sp. F2068]|uniref:C-terminal binding protein n=1 Tax=Pseudohalocynthiibacter sp. F2068 TaxID=2926418 RepID=UPI001FF639D2|nr:C-terminal binding protein [Pseudohalocynthiibacter sp. F2068]MCK0104291.1 C-terminal binding protein [Pseudohalocynthiibacter sp. F2068]